MINLFWVIIGIFVIFSALFAGSETVLVASDKQLFKDKAKKGDKSAKRVLKLFSKPDRFLATTLVGTNVCIVSVSILFKTILEHYTEFSDIQLSLVTTIIITVCMLILSEVIPKTIGLVKSNSLAPISTNFVNIIYYIFFPVIIVVQFISNMIGKIFNLRKKGSSQSIFMHKGELKKFVIKTNLIEDIESSYINNIMNYSKTTAREIMTPLVDVISIEQNTSIDVLLKVISEKGYSRIPIYRQRVDNLVGYVKSMDLIYDTDCYTFEHLIKEPYYIPETKKIGQILMDMQRRRIPMVFVVDEYGGTSGVITDEDIAEEIVGDILFETEEESILEFRNKELLVVNAQVDVDDLNENYGLGIHKDGFETIAGFIMYILGHIPKKGEHLEYKGYKYIVEEADETSISKVIIKKLFKK